MAGRKGCAMAAALLATALLGGCAQPAPDRAVMAASYPVYVALSNVIGDAEVSRGVLSPQDGSGTALSEADRAILTDGAAMLFASGYADAALLQAVRGLCPDLPVTGLDDDPGLAGALPWTRVSGHIQEVRRVADALCAWDPDRAESYRRNADAYILRLNELDALYARMLSNVAGQRVVLFRESFHPLFTAYGLEVAEIVSRSEEEYLSAQRLAGIASLCAQEGVKLLVVETGADPAAAEAVSAQTGIPVVQLDTLLGFAPDPAADDSGEYIRVMKENLDMIAQALIWGGEKP